jgi:7-keto-8-aminopelargonate synthetase-like enzyme
MLAEPLQLLDRTSVLYRGRKLTYFAGCDYFRLASHPIVLKALRSGLDEFGLNVAASRKTTGNHQLYEKLELELARFFDVEAAVLVSNGYMTNLATAQALAGEFTHALIDERSHGCLFDATRFLECKHVLFKHRDPQAAADAAQRCGRQARIILLTDGLFSHSGEVAPLDDYLRLLPSNTTLLVDDAHAAGILGRHGRGTGEHLGLNSRRIIQTLTLSKALGIYGGAVLGSGALRAKITSRSRLFVGSTPLPLPLAVATLASLKLLQTDKRLRRRLLFNTSYVKGALREAGLNLNSGPAPIIPITLCDIRRIHRLRRALFAADIYPPYINYLGGPRHAYFRFVISSEHTPEQLDNLVKVLISRASNEGKL